MPVVGMPEGLEAAVRSVLDQTFGDLELVIAAEPGDDGLEEFVRNLGDGRVRLLRNEERLGLARSLNAGIAASRGELIARMDADDVSLPTRLEKQVAFLDAHPEVGVLGTHLRFPDGTPDHYGNDRLPSDPHFTRWVMHFQNAVAHPTVVMRRAVWERCCGYRSELEPCEDYDIWLRAMRFTDILSLPEALVSYRTAGESVSSTRREEQKRRAQELAIRTLEITFGRPVEPAIARAALNPYCITTPREGIKAAHLIYMLYSSFHWWERVRGRDLAGIQGDASARLSHILARSIKVSPARSSMVLWQVSRFGPRTFFKVVADMPARGAEFLK